MTTLPTTNPSSQPLERKKTPAPVLPDLEYSDKEGPLGFYNPNEFQEYKVKTSGMSGTGSINFDTDKVVQPSVVSEMFDVSDKWISIKPSNVAEQVVNTASTVINVTGDLASASIDAGSDLFNQITGKAEKTEVPKNFQKAFEGNDPSKLDPTVPKKQEQQDVIRARENANTVIENATRQASQQEYEEMIKMALRLGVNVENLADKLDAPHLRKSDLLKTYYLALGDSLQIAEQKAAARTRVNVLASPVKHGAEGPGMVMEDNRQNETQHGKNAPG